MPTDIDQTGYAEMHHTNAFNIVRDRTLSLAILVFSTQLRKRKWNLTLEDALE